MSRQPQVPTNPDQLLKWSIAAQNGGTGNENDPGIRQVADDIAAGRRPDLADPGLFDALMGKSEAQMMREELGVALDESRPETDRVQALDNFEMLIEQIDNANNITSMKMWQPLIGLLNGPSTTAGIQTAALWIIGTAVQNNDKAQMAILAFDPLTPILSLLVHGSDGQVRGKALYALSGILKHNAKAVRLFIDHDGWSSLRGALLDPDISLRRKSAFLINSLLLQDDSATQSTNAPSSTSSARSTSTAVGPVPNSAPPSAPLEQPPATHADGIQHPSIVGQLVESNLLNTLIVSLLPTSLQSTLPSDSLNGIDTATYGGPDGDIELRDDADYSEKASRACLTFIEKCQEAKENGKNVLEKVDEEQKKNAKILLNALQSEWNGKPIEEDQQTRWQELGLTKSELDSFKEGVKQL